MMFLELFKGRISFLTQGPTGRSEVTSLLGGPWNTSLYNLLESPLSTPAQIRRFRSSRGQQSSVPYRTYLGSGHWAPHSRFSSRLPTTSPCSCHQVLLLQQLGLDLQHKAAILSITSWETLFTFTEQTSQESL